MSIRWWAYSEWTPPFKGSIDEEQRNFLSHKWETVKVAQMYSSSDIEKTWCSSCHAISGDEAMKYPCGTIPAKVNWETYRNEMVSLGRTESLPYSYLKTTGYKG
jgi:hypothetical protein